MIDKESLNNWSFQGSVKKAYDKSCKGFILLFDHSTKCQMPVDPRATDLYLVQPFLLLQLMITDKKVFHIEVVITDQMNVKRRLLFNPGAAYSYTKDNMVKQQLHARIPCDLIRENVWLNLQLDIQSFVETCFGSVNFRSIDCVMISGSCRLRKIMTMKQMLVDSTSIWLENEYGPEIAQDFEEKCGGIDYQSEDLPGNLNFTPGVEYANQVISYDRARYWGYIQEMMNNGGNGSEDKKNRKKPDIAFGRRIVDKPIIAGQKQIQTAIGQVKVIKREYSPQRVLEGASKEGIIYNQLRKDGSEGRQYRGGYQRTINDDSRGRMAQNESGYINSQEYDVTTGSAFENLSQPQLRQSVLPRSMKNDPEETSGIDFNQYKISPNKMAQMNNKSSNNSVTKVMKRSIINSSNQSPAARRQNNDNSDVYLNERIRYLEQQRGLIHQLADKYNLQNNVKVEKLSLITVLYPSKGHYHGGGQDGSFINAQDPKERIKEYHEIVNKKRRQIHEKQKIKKLIQKEEQNASKNDFVNLTSNNEHENQQENDEQRQENGENNEENSQQNQQKQSRRQGGQGQGQTEGNVEGWEGDQNDENEDYGNEEGEEKEDGAEDDYGKEENNDDYGKEEDDGGKGDEKEGEYGEEQEDANNNEEEAEGEEDEAGGEDAEEKGDDYGDEEY